MYFPSYFFELTIRIHLLGRIFSQFKANQSFFCTLPIKKSNVCVIDTNCLFQWCTWNRRSTALLPAIIEYLMILLGRKSFRKKRKTLRDMNELILIDRRSSGINTITPKPHFRMFWTIIRWPDIQQNARKWTLPYITL